MGSAGARLGRRSFVLVMLVFTLLAGVVSVGAQAATPLAIGENQTGQILDPAVPVRYAISSVTPISVQLQVLAISSGFAPTFRVIDPTGLVTATVPNNGTQTIVQGTANLASAGTYIIEVSSALNATGQFLISVQAGAPLAPPVPLPVGSPVNGTLNPQVTRQAYSFSGSETDALLLTVRSAAPDAGPVVVLRDAESGETLALNSARLAGTVYRLGAGLANYLVEVTYGGGIPQESYVICLAAEAIASACPGIVSVQAVQPTALPTIFIPTLIPTSIVPPTLPPPTINPAGPCLVVTRGQFVNVRSGPATSFNVLTQLSPSGSGAVIGRLPDNTWWQVNVNGFIGWVSAAVVTLGGNCAGVPVVIPPTAIVPSATVIPPLATTEVSPFTATPSNTPTATPTTVPTIAPTLNFSLSPNYGSTALTSGFVPDPFTVGINSGGAVNVSYLGGGCAGFATSAPDFSVNYTAGAFPTLRFYYIGSRDTTMIINSPSGSYSCIDDSFGTVDPTIDFNSPMSGRYDIWIGSYAQGENSSGTLYVTENTGNHP